MSYFGTVVLWPFRYETRANMRWRRWVVLGLLPYETGSRLIVDVRVTLLRHPNPEEKDIDHRLVMVTESTRQEKDPVGGTLDEWRAYDFGLASFSGAYRLDVMKMRTHIDRGWEEIPVESQEVV